MKKEMLVLLHIQWLKETLGDYSEAGFDEPSHRKHMTDDEESYYSIYCSIAYLMRRKETREIVYSKVQQLAPYIGVKTVLAENLENTLGIMTLYDLLILMQESEKEISLINSQLHSVTK